jgi:hypothetical protein
MEIRNYLALSACALAAGCGTYAEATPLNAPPRALNPRAAETVEVYASSPPSEPHVDVAIIRVDQTVGAPHEGLDTMVAELREKAGQMGCDALFISGASERAGVPPGDVLNLLDPGSHLLMATCIAYLAPKPPPLAARTPVAASPAAPAPSPVAVSLVSARPVHP